MKLTTKQLRKIIKEELSAVTLESRDVEDEEDWPWGTHEDDRREREHFLGPEGDDGYEMDQDAYDIYDQAIRLTYDQLSRLIGHLSSYRDDPESTRTK